MKILKRPLPSANLGKALGTSYYIAPEVIEKDYNEKCDIWSIGCILYAMLTGCAPFNGEDDTEILKRVKRGDYDIGTLRDAGVSEMGISFIRKMLVKDVDQRISALEALEDPWIIEHFARNNEEEGLAT